MTFDPEDPRLTAFALDELEPGDRAEIEALVQKDPEARAFVDGIRETARVLDEDFRREAMLALPLDSARRDAIDRRLVAVPPSQQRPRFLRPAMFVAASLLVMGTASLYTILQGERHAERRGRAVVELAQAPQPQVAAPKAPTQATNVISPDIVAETTSQARSAEALFGEAGPGRNRSVVRAGEDVIASDSPSEPDSRRPSSVRRKMAGPPVLDRADPSKASEPRMEMSYAPEAPSPVAAPSDRKAGLGRRRALRLRAAIGDEAGRPRSNTPAPPMEAAAAKSDQTLLGMKAAEPTLPTKPAQPSGSVRAPAGAMPELSRQARAEVEAKKAKTSLEPSTSPETYAPHDPAPFIAVATSGPRSILSLSVETASYSEVRLALKAGRSPNPEAIRVEEWLNRFPDRKLRSAAGEAFATSVEMAGCPWEPDHRLLRIQLQAPPVPAERKLATNLLLVADTSESMVESDKLPLLKRAFVESAGKLRANDRMTIISFADSARVELPSTPADRSAEILRAIEGLATGGGTDGGSAMDLASRTAAEQLDPAANNQVLLFSDGDFNRGPDREAVLRATAGRVWDATPLTVVGLGGGNLQDDFLRNLAAHAGGRFAYADTAEEAQKLLSDVVDQDGLIVARDIQVEVEFDPARIASYRALGYDSIVPSDPDVKDEGVQGDGLAAGTAATFFYEIVPVEHRRGDFAANRPQAAAPASAGVGGGQGARTPLELAKPDSRRADLVTVKVRFRLKEGGPSGEVVRGIFDDGRAFEAASPDFRFSSSVAAFAEILRGLPAVPRLPIARIVEIATDAMGDDQSSDRLDFLELVRTPRP